MFTPKSGFFPFYLSILLGILALALLLKSLWEEKGKTADVIVFGKRSKHMVICVLALIAYVYALKPLGFIVASLLMFFLIMKWIERRSWKLTLAVSLPCTLGFYFLSVHYLGIPLPRGMLLPF